MDLLTAAGRRTTVLLVLEDVHWADSPTLLLVRHLVRAGAEARMLLVATFRDAEAEVPAELSETLVDVQRTEGVVRVRLGGLSGGEVAEFVRLAAGIEASADVTATIGELTEGNAFFVTELWRELVDSDSVHVGITGIELAATVGALGTPETVREVVSQRLVRLEPETIEMLELAAVAGFGVRAGHPAESVAPAGEERCSTRSTRRRATGSCWSPPGRGLGYRFTHELVRRAVADRLSASRRAELHLRVGETIERCPPGEMREPASRRSRITSPRPHRSVSRSARSSTTCWRRSRRGRSLAFGEAVSHLRTALELGILDPRERGTAYLELGGEPSRGSRVGRDRGLRRVGRIARRSPTRSCSPGGDRLRGGLLASRDPRRGLDRHRWRRPQTCSTTRTRSCASGCSVAWPEALDFRGEYDRGTVARDEAIRWRDG